MQCATCIFAIDFDTMNINLVLLLMLLLQLHHFGIVAVGVVAGDAKIAS